MYSKEELGITQFESLRAEADRECTDKIEFKSFLEKNFDGMFLSDKRNNLKQFVQLMDGSVNDFQLFKTCLTKFQWEYNNTQHNLSPFSFGTSVMRLMHWLNQPDAAILVRYGYS